MRAIRVIEHLSSVRRRTVHAFLYLLCSIVLCSSVMAEPQVFLNSNGIPGIELFGGEHVPDKVATAITASNIGAILRYTVVVRNTGLLPITGLDVRYEIITDRDEIVNNFFYGSPVDIADSASLPVIAPSQTAVIGPNHLTNEQLMSWGRLSLSDKHTSSIAKTIELLERADRINISVDSVIRSDGILAGPDRSGTLRKFRQEIEGYKEFRNQLLKRFSRGDSDEDIVAWLVETSNTRLVRPGKNQPLDRSVIIKKSLAQEYLSYMKQGRRQYARDTLETAVPELKLRRIIKVHREVQP